MRLLRRHSQQCKSKLADKAIRRFKEHYVVFFERSAAGIVLVTPGGQLIDCNAACTSLLGYGSRAELLTRTWQDLLWNPGLDVALLGDLKTGARYHSEEIRLRRRDGKPVWVLSSANWIPSVHSQGGVVQITLMGITRQKRAEAQLRRISRNLATIQEQERRTIARELHDATSQVLAALKMDLGVVQRSGAHLGSAGKRALADCFALTQEATRQVRTLSHLLYPPLLEKFGVWEALRVYVNDFRKTSRLAIQMSIGDGLEQRGLPRAHQVALFRIVQAALMNVHLHSRSKDVVIDLFQDRNQIVLQVKDSGQGLPTKVIRSLETVDGGSLGVGISGMRERVTQLGGEFSVETSKSGTKITAVLPCPRRGRVLEAVRERKQSALKSA